MSYDNLDRLTNVSINSLSWVYSYDAIGNILKIVRKTREHPNVEIGSSPRGGLALLKVSRAMAASRGRDFVTPDDVKMFASDALSHRIILKIEYALEGHQPQEIVEQVVSEVEVPKDWARG